MKTILKLLGWTINIKALNSIKKSIIIQAPHTSNWDLILGIMAAKACKLNVKFIVKQEWNISIIGKLLSYFGALFVDRSSTNGVTESISNKMKRLNNGHIVFTPEGTRSKVTKWKSGFYYVAFQSHLPISVGYIDYKKKEVGINHIFYPSGDIEKDCKDIQAFYKTIKAKKTQNYHPDWII